MIKVVSKSSPSLHKFPVLRFCLPLVVFVGSGVKIRPRGMRQILCGEEPFRGSCASPDTLLESLLSTNAVSVADEVVGSM